MKQVKKKNILTILIILIIIAVISIIFLNIMLRNTAKGNLKYINSEEIEKGTVSPKMIHTVIAKYEGKVNPKAISKATYYFINNRIPKYLEKCIDEQTTKEYFEKNKEDILIDIGIEKEEEFMNLIGEIKKLKGELEFESSRFVMNEIEVNSDSTSANLYIKYKNNEEIAVKMTISNQVYSYKTSIKFSK